MDGNGWDAVTLDPGATLTVPLSAAGPIDLEIRLLTPNSVPGDDRAAIPAPRRRHRRRPAATPELGADFSVVKTSVDLPAGAPLRLEAIDPITVQSVTGFVPDPGPPAGWSVATSTDDAVVWQRDP